MDQAKQQQQDHDLLIRIDEKMEGMTRALGDLSRNSGEKLAVMESQKVNKEDMQKWISELKADIDKSFRNFMEEQKDHEKRLRRLERWGFTAIGAIGLIEIIIAAHK